MASGRGRRFSRHRSVALILGLLFALGVLAPTAARSLGAHHDHPHPIAVAVRMVADQTSGAQRDDQPQLVPVATASPRTDVAAGSTGDPSTIANSVTVDSLRTRGPPLQAL